MKHLLLFVLLAGCASDGSTPPVSGEIRGAPFEFKMAARITNDDPNVVTDFEVYRFADFDVCSTPGIEPDSTFLDVYVPKSAAPGTFAVSHLTTGDVGISMQRAVGKACDTQGDYAKEGTATIDNGDYTFLRGTIDGSRDADHVSGSFTTTCSISIDDAYACLAP